MNHSEQGTKNVQVGSKVPEFEAEALYPDGSFKNFKFSDVKGKWLVVFFYPLDFTFVCPTEIRGFEEARERFKAAGAEIVSVSTDSVYTHKAWVEHGLGKVNFPMISDLNHTLSRLFGVLVPEKGIALRGTFVIDPGGVLRSAVINDLSVGRSVEETLRTLQAFKTGGLTGCGWTPGSPTLK